MIPYHHPIKVVTQVGKEIIKVILCSAIALQGSVTEGRAIKTLQDIPHTPPQPSLFCENAGVTDMPSDGAVKGRRIAHENNLPNSQTSPYAENAGGSYTPPVPAASGGYNTPPLGGYNPYGAGYPYFPADLNDGDANDNGNKSGVGMVILRWFLGVVGAIIVAYFAHYLWRRDQFQLQSGFTADLNV